MKNDDFYLPGDLDTHLFFHIQWAVIYIYKSEK